MFVKKRKNKKKVSRAENKTIVEEEDDPANTKYPLIESTKADSTQDRAAQLAKTAKAQKVPSTRLARVATFGSLGFSLGLGTLAEASRRALGTSKPKKGDSKLDGSEFIWNISLIYLSLS